MPRLAANLSWLFQEHDFLARFEAARRVGFRAVECLFPYATPAEETAAPAAMTPLMNLRLDAFFRVSSVIGMSPIAQS